MTVRRIFAILVFFFVIVSAFPAAASFLFEVPVLTQDAIEKLDDKSLLEVYTDVMIELEAVRTFYENSGFAPKEYRQFKELLRYKINLIGEIQKRALSAPRLEL